MYLSTYNIKPHPVKAFLAEPPGRIEIQPCATPAYNGSMTMDDVFDMWAQVCAQGFIPDTLLVHPMAWIMWVKDPVLREFAIQNGGGSFFAQWGGNPAAQKTNFYNFNGLGLGNGQKTVATNGTQTSPATAADLPQNQTSAPQLPGYLGMPFRIWSVISTNFRTGWQRSALEVLHNSRKFGSDDPKLALSQKTRN